MLKNTLNNSGFALGGFCCISIVFSKPCDKWLWGGPDRIFGRGLMMHNTGQGKDKEWQLYVQ